MPRLPCSSSAPRALPKQLRDAIWAAYRPGQLEQLATVATVALEVGDLERATAIPLSITSFGEHLGEFVELAGKNGTGRAQLLARALTTEHWEWVVGSLASVDPESVGAIADEYLRVTSGEH